MKQALIIFVRNPELGKVKTRLAGTLGDQAALRIYTYLLEQTRHITGSLPVDKWVFYADFVPGPDLWDPAHYQKELQRGAGLGERMQFAFDRLFARGYDEVVIIGSDCPELPPGTINTAFTCLRSHDVVLGPSEDGGYYLLGLTRMHNRLFSEIDWSTDQVFGQTLDRCREEGLSIHRLPVQADVDDEAGWHRYMASRLPFMTLLFVYNAGSSLFSTVTDWVHKVLSPATYSCSLCALTHHHTGMKTAWVLFVKALPYPAEFLHRDEFFRQYPALRDTGLPAIFFKDAGNINLLLPAEELDRFTSLQDLEQGLLAKLLPV